MRLKEDPIHRHDNGHASFGSELRRWRRYRGMSQLAFSLEAGVSSRHMSFLETGRSRPSREMVHVIVETLDLPLRERNRLLLAAGYAPSYSESPLDGPAMARVRRIIRLLLERHEPYPAYAMDGAWNVVASNESFEAGIRELLPDAGPDQTGNILRLFLAPDLLRPYVVDWKRPARALLRRALSRLDEPAAPTELAAVLDEVRGYPGVADLLEEPADPAGFELFMPLTIQDGETTWRWLTTIITFGSAVDITVDDLVVECFFPADAETELGPSAESDSPAGGAVLRE